MSVSPSRTAPPARADRLLLRSLPEGDLGLSIVGDLHQEHVERAESRGLRAANRWYWRSAIGLAARYAALRMRAQLTHTLHERSGVEFVTTLWADIRFGFRMLLKTPMLSLIAIVTVALGVALTTHTFSSIYGSVVRGLPVPNPDRLMYVSKGRPDLGFTDMELSMHEFEDVRSRQTAFEALDGYYQGTMNLGGDEGPPERFAGAFVTASALDNLAVPPALGRTFRPGEDEPDAAPVVVLSHEVWQNRYGRDPGVVGRLIRLNGETAEIVGVMPPGFAFPFDERIWAPHRIAYEALEWGSGQDVNVFGRLREGVTLEAARAELGAIASSQAREYPETNENAELAVSPFVERYMPAEIQAVLWVMLGATFGVLLIACVNVANLLLARAAIRSKEMAVRTALGASRFRVVRQLMAESLVLAVVGGVVGLWVATWGLGVYNTMLAGIEKPYWIDFRVDLPVFLFSVGVTVLAAVAAGMLPALRASAVDVGEVLKDESRGSSSLSLGRFSSALVIAEIAVSASVLVAAGFMVKSVINVGSVDLGFETENVLTGRVALFEADYPTAESRMEFFDRLKERLAVEPGVGSAALGTSLPGLGTGRYYMAIEGRAYATDADHPVASTSSVTEDYFTTFGVDVLQGRDFDRLDRAGEGQDVAIVSESFARLHFPGEDPLGKRVRLGATSSTRPWLAIVGVVPDLHIGGGVGGIGDDQLSPERLFLPLGSLDATFMSFAMATQGPPAEMASRLRAVVAEVDPNLPVYNLWALDQAIEQATWAFGLFGGLFAIFGVAALFLAAVGLYGVISFSVAQRRQELGVRMALGADRREIMGLVLRKGGGQLALGMVLGLLLGALMARPLRVILYGVEVGDPLVYVSIVLTLSLTGLVALVVPARAATRTDPIEAMRTQ